MRQWIARAPMPIRLGLAAGAGALGALGQAPYDQPVAHLLALTVAFAFSRAQPTAWAAAAVGWAFGTGYFALALVWIVEPFQVDVARHGWMAPFALGLLSGGLALFWGGAFWLARRLSSAGFVLVLTWTAAEMMRAYVFTGFPWATPAQAAIDGPMSRVLAWGGPHFTTLCLMVLAWALSVPARAGARAGLWGGQAALMAGALLALYLPLANAPSDPTGHWVRLVQPNAEQHLKWQPDHAEVFYRRQLAFTAAAPAQQDQAPDLIVWPETAIPWRLETAAPILSDISVVAQGTPVVLGALRAEGLSLRNALVVLDPAGSPSAIYDKHHLVPFGEYIPFASLAARFGLRGLVEQAGGFSKGPGPVLLDIGPMGRALPLICYEAVFAHGVGDAPARPDFLLQITNDAWFGTHAGPQQHLAQARMRAIEQGIPLVRAANTGISAMIDPLGRVTRDLPLGATGFLDAPLPAALPPTLYSRTGDVPMMWLLVLALAVAATRNVRRRSAETD